MKPSPGVITPEPIPREWVSATALPWWSTTVTCVVSGDSPGTNDTRMRFPAAMCARHSAARSLETIHSWGTSTNSGSPRKGLRSAKAAFIAMETQ